MSGVVVYLILITALFMMALVTKRRIGAPILGLAAGTILGNLWAESIASWIMSRGTQVDSFVLLGVVTGCLILIPAALLLMHGHTHKSGFQRVLSALLFTVVGLAFLVEPFGGVINPDGVTDGISEVLITYKNAIITAGLSLAVIDLIATKLQKPQLPKKRKH